MLSKFRDVRVYWALHEIAERREAACRRQESVSRGPRRIRLDASAVAMEIRRLTAIQTLSAIRSSLRRLERAGLVTVNGDGIGFVRREEVEVGDLDQLTHAMASRIDHREAVHTRTVRIPRRTLRYLASCGRPAVVATMLGAMMRSLWVRRGRLITAGSWSVGFVATVFDVHERNVKRARRFLLESGWLTPLEAPSWHVNRYGVRAKINVAWSGRRRSPEGFCVRGRGISESPPPTARDHTSSPPPIKKQYLPSGSKNQYPASGGRSGVRKRTGRVSTPTLQHVGPEDLRETERLRMLFREGVACGLLGDCPADELRFFAAAEHARRHGTLNPCGLFVALVRGNRWSFLTQADEDAARRRLVADQPAHRSETRRSSGPRSECSALISPDPRVNRLIARVAGLRSISESVHAGTSEYWRRVHARCA